MWTSREPFSTTPSSCAVLHSFACCSSPGLAMSDDEIQDPPLPLPTTGAFTAVPGYPSVVTCPSLRTYQLGLAGPNNLICCITCPPTTLLNLTSCATHVKTHMVKPVNSSTFRVPRKRIMELLQRLNAFTGHVSTLDFVHNVFH